MTPLGKELRKWRIEREMLLGEMAERLRMSSSYLSQIEKGGKPIPAGFVDRAASILGLDAAQTIELKRAGIRSTQEFSLTVEDQADREVAHQFVTEFARLSPDKKDAIRRMLGG